MFTFDAKFYCRNAVLEEHPWYLVPSKWMMRAHLDDNNVFMPTDESPFPPRILHICMQSPYNASGGYGEFLNENVPHDFRCKRCQMRPSDKMITLHILLK
jgi:hypothetical protein